MLYDAIRDDLQTGDLVLFQGRGPISLLIRASGPWSHVGMVLRTELGVLLWESTTLSTTKDIEVGRTVQGVQLVPLSQRLAGTRARVAIRRLSPGLLKGQVADIMDLRVELSRRPYERRHLDLLRAWWEEFPGAQAEDLSSVFCSELVAEALQRAGLLPEPPEGRPSDRWCPSDFGAGERIDDHLGRRGGAWRYGPEILVEAARAA